MLSRVSCLSAKIHQLSPYHRLIKGMDPLQEHESGFVSSKDDLSCSETSQVTLDSLFQGVGTYRS